MKFLPSCMVVLAACHLTLASAPPPGSGSVETLIKKLDAEGFWTRQRAEKELNLMGPTVLPRLRKELALSKSFEVRARLHRLIAGLELQDRMGSLMKRLGSTKPEVWVSADKELRQVGTTGLPALKKELRPGLDLNQRRRLERIIADLSR